MKKKWIDKTIKWMFLLIDKIDRIHSIYSFNVRVNFRNCEIVVFISSVSKSWMMIRWQWWWMNNDINEIFNFEKIERNVN